MIRLLLIVAAILGAVSLDCPRDSKEHESRNGKTVAEPAPPVFHKNPA